MKKILIILLCVAANAYGQGGIIPAGGAGNPTSVNLYKGMVQAMVALKTGTDTGNARRVANGVISTFPDTIRRDTGLLICQGNMLWYYTGTHWVHVDTSAGSGGTPGMPYNSIQFNINSNFRGSSKFTYQQDTLRDSAVNYITGVTQIYGPLGFYGSTPVAKQTGDVYTALAYYGLLGLGGYDWVNVYHTPTTLSGYGITDGLSNPMSDEGDMIYGGPSGVPTNLPGNTATDLMVLTQTGDGVNSAAPVWQVVPGPAIPANEIAFGTGTGVTSSPDFTNSGVRLYWKYLGNPYLHIQADLQEFGASNTNGTSIEIIDADKTTTITNAIAFPTKVVATATPLNIPAGVARGIFDPASPVMILTVYVQLPYPAQDGQPVFVSFGGTVTTGVVAANVAFVTDGASSDIILGTPPTSFNAGETVVFTYNADNLSWSWK